MNTTPTTATTSPALMTLAAALDAYLERARGRRSYKCLESQARAAVRDLVAMAAYSGPANMGPGDANPVDVQRATRLWYDAGLSPATINKRLSCLSAMGVNVGGCRARDPRPLKWWLNPEDQRRLLAWLADPHSFAAPDDQARANYYRTRSVAASVIEWTCYTGLRIEETLALTWRDFSGPIISRTAVTVPGTKTAAAQATLPLSNEATQVLIRRGYRDTWPLALWRPQHKWPFPITYDQLHHVWQDCRRFLGVEDVPTATLKALRRSAARYLHITRGMPLAMVKDYLRHENIETTMGYLRLTGGYQEEEFRKWL